SASHGASHAPASTETYTPSLHDALPISDGDDQHPGGEAGRVVPHESGLEAAQHRPATSHRRPQPVDGPVHTAGIDLESGELCESDRKSTRLNSSHVKISYAVFCLKKKKK